MSSKSKSNEQSIEARTDSARHCSGSKSIKSRGSKLRNRGARTESGQMAIESSGSHSKQRPVSGLVCVDCGQPVEQTETTDRKHFNDQKLQEWSRRPKGKQGKPFDQELATDTDKGRTSIASVEQAFSH